MKFIENSNNLNKKMVMTDINIYGRSHTELFYKAIIGPICTRLKARKKEN